MSRIARKLPPRKTKPICRPTLNESECTDSRHNHGFGVGDLKQIATQFARSRTRGNQAELLWYARMPNWEAALEAAALCWTKANGMHDHQRRVGRAAVQRAHRRLARAELQASQSFHELFERIEKAVHGLDRIGELYIYDVAQRVGAWLGLRPDHVYLHAGTRSGARALGLSANRSFLTRAELPPALRHIQPALLEDFFCMRKHCLRPSMLGDWSPPDAKRR